MRHLTQWQNYMKWTSPKGECSWKPASRNDFGHLPQGNFVHRLWQLQGAYAWNPNLVLSSFIQYDTESQNVGTNTRLRWTIKPGMTCHRLNRGCSDWSEPKRDKYRATE